MRITKKVREEAALLCQLAVSNNQSLADSHLDTYDGLQVYSHAWDVWGVALKARLAASEAWVGECHDEERYAISCAEAEAMLRTGWVPDGQ